MRSLFSQIFMTLAAVCSLCGVNSVQGVGVGKEMGPFCLQVQGAQNINRAVSIDNPVCYAMQARKVLVLTVQIDEAVNNQQFMNYTKKLTVEPYLYGLDRNQAPVLCGNILRNEIITQGNANYGANASTYNNTPSLFTGMVTWLGSQPSFNPVNVWKVLNVEVNQNAAFFPKQDMMQTFAGHGINPICSVLPMTQLQSQNGNNVPSNYTPPGGSLQF